ncbi:hypothetical protein FRC07_002186, partial [Ceratobasidium sp. 392]
HSEHDHVLSIIWQVTWASAAPPFVLMIAVIIEGHILDVADATLGEDIFVRGSKKYRNM